MSAVEQRSTSAAQTQVTAKPKKNMSIGVVLETLKTEFPDVTLSKIRFLESEGLISPERTPSGYRRFKEADVDRLRYILTTQRDHYLPLKVIREQLDAMDSGAVTPITRSGTSEPLIAAEKFRAPTLTRLTDADVAERAGVDVEQVLEFVKAGVLHSDHSGYFTADDVQIAAFAASLMQFGVDERHLKSLRNAAARQADLIARATAPMAKAQGGQTRERAEELSQEMSALVVSMHASLLKALLREELS
ncbi:transcriptional regulator FtsR [Corynebacterium gerontici]|uniref:Zinc-responsive transcriptional regulator n=1 Tax=Corynebacterium gerontici TaxID=2079234 RepID=A0A3G6J4P5_9CORY|nr:MerR family transcriptional regulator [Corynebacterium gerontici]AZA11380.1 zinc-responsive transcriptional regulator [Corynebacterium gerontici]